MRVYRRPYIGRIWADDWTDLHTGEVTPGIKLGGASGIAAHLTAEEALTLADKLVDLAEQLPQATQQPQARAEQPCRPSPLYSTQTLTDATGAPEPPLPTTSAD